MNFTYLDSEIFCTYILWGIGPFLLFCQLKMKIISRICDFDFVWIRRMDHSNNSLKRNLFSLMYKVYLKKNKFVSILLVYAVVYVHYWLFIWFWNLNMKCIKNRTISILSKISLYNQNWFLFLQSPYSPIVHSGLACRPAAYLWGVILGVKPPPKWVSKEKKYRYT